jgi:SOS response regulatory protein OraA/RecX
VRRLRARGLSVEAARAAAIAAIYRQIQWVAEHGALDHSGAAAACIRDQITLSAHMRLIDDEAHAAMLAALAEAEGTNFL